MGTLLDTIDSPQDVKKLSIEQLIQLSAEIRETLIAVLAATGGHLGPNLGVVELTVAMHFVFNVPTDRFVFDVSHQSYVHKLLTGRRDRLSTIRQYGGLSGFMLRSESEYDCYGAGHAGTALSAALGMATARDILNDREHVVALLGDAAFTNGISFEALNNIASTTRRLIVILNDNEWSIDKNVGAIAKYLNKIATNKKYAQLRERATQMVERLGGRAARKALHKTEEAAKSLLWPSVLFEEFGLRYFGPLDGHDIPSLVETLAFLKTQDYPVILHALTQKGRGFQPALAAQKKFHGLGPFDPVTGMTTAPSAKTYSDIFAETLVRLAEKDDKIVAITAAMPNGTGLDYFRAKYPNRYFDVGIAEEHAVVFAAGLATKGLKPFCAIYSTFLQRALDPIIHDVCLQNLHVVFCIDRGGLSADDGPTHHGLFDISYLRCIPNLIHMDPKDEDELADMLLTASQHCAPVAIRYPRGSGTGVETKAEPDVLSIGQAELLQKGTDIAILFLGPLRGIANELSGAFGCEGFSSTIINARYAKPLDIDMIERHVKEAQLLITLEDHALNGGFSSAVLELLNDLAIKIPFIRVGWPDQFIEHGHRDILRNKHGMTAAAILRRAQRYLAHADRRNVASAS